MDMIESIATEKKFIEEGKSISSLGFGEADGIFTRAYPVFLDFLAPGKGETIAKNEVGTLSKLFNKAKRKFELSRDGKINRKRGKFAPRPRNRNRNNHRHNNSEDEDNIGSNGTSSDSHSDSDSDSDSESDPFVNSEHDSETDNENENENNRPREKEQKKKKKNN